MCTFSPLKSQSVHYSHSWVVPKVHSPWLHSFSDPHSSIPNLCDSSFRLCVVAYIFDPIVVRDNFIFNQLPQKSVFSLPNVKCSAWFDSFVKVHPQTKLIFISAIMLQKSLQVTQRVTFDLRLAVISLQLAANCQTQAQALSQTLSQSENVNISHEIVTYAS